jgi:hypothetical protein
VYDTTTNYKNWPELLQEAEHSAHAYRVLPSGDNIEVLDGQLIKALIGQVINLIIEKQITVLPTFYLDPHAYIANQAALYVITAHKAAGSDVLNSIANHRRDGEVRFPLLQLLSEGIMLAV